MVTVMKRLADLDPEILAKIFGGKAVSITPPDSLKSGLSALSVFSWRKRLKRTGRA